MTQEQIIEAIKTLTDVAKVSMSHQAREAAETKIIELIGKMK